MNRTVALLLLPVLIVAPAYGKAKKDKSEINITLDQEGLKGRPTAVGSAWMGYGMARANWVSAHVLGKLPAANDYHRSYDEELAGRETLAKIWSELKASDATAKAVVQKTK